MYKYVCTYRYMYIYLYSYRYIDISTFPQNVSGILRLLKNNHEKNRHDTEDVSEDVPHSAPPHP